MKLFYVFILLAFFVSGYSQTKRSAHKKTHSPKSFKNAVTPPGASKPAQPRETATDRYLKGPADKNPDANTSAVKNAGSKSAFAGGVHAAANAGEKFDTVSAKVNDANTNNVTSSSGTFANDTIFNTNTVINNGVTTNSGAVDRSGQAQFGQTNWGNSRSTVGESQWTIPPPITASFSKEFPAAGNLTWTRNNTDTSIYSARYKSGETWITTNYNVSGQRLDMRTEMPLTLLPQPVSAYISKLPTDLQVSTISKWQVYGKPDVYEIQTRTGKTLYVNNDGTDSKR